MIKVLYQQRKTKRREVVVLWEEVWEGTYRETLYPVYARTKKEGEYTVREFREGLIVELPTPEVEQLNVPELVFDTKKEIKITEVFKHARKKLLHSK